MIGNLFRAAEWVVHTTLRLTMNNRRGLVDYDEPVDGDEERLCCEVADANGRVCAIHNPRCPECDGLGYKHGGYLHHLNCSVAQESSAGIPGNGPAEPRVEAAPPSADAGHLLPEALLERIEGLEAYLVALRERVDELALNK